MTYYHNTTYTTIITTVNNKILLVAIWTQINDHGQLDPEGQTENKKGNLINGVHMHDWHNYDMIVCDLQQIYRYEQLQYSKPYLMLNEVFNYGSSNRQSTPEIRIHKASIYELCCNEQKTYFSNTVMTDALTRCQWVLSCLHMWQLRDKLLNVTNSLCSMSFLDNNASMQHHFQHNNWK